MAAVLDKSGAWSLGESVLWYNPHILTIDATWSLGENVIIDEVFISPPFSALSIKVDGVWKQAIPSHVKVNNSWKVTSGVYIKVSGVWKLITIVDTGYSYLQTADGNLFLTSDSKYFETLGS